MSTAGKPASTTDARVTQLNFPGTLRPMPIAPAKGKPAKSGNVSTNPQVIHRQAKPEPVPKASKVDWDGMEPHYRANLMTLRVLGAQYGVSHVSIHQHAQQFGWTRNLEARIADRAQKLTDRASVNKLPTKTQLLGAELVVGNTALVIANIRITQRERFSRAAILYTRLFEDLETQVMERQRIQTFADQLASVSDPGSFGKLAAMKMKELVDVPAQIRAFKDLTAIGAQLTEQEKSAYKLDKAPEEGDGGRANLPVRFVETKYIERDKDDIDG